MIRISGPRLRRPGVGRRAVVGLLAACLLPGCGTLAQRSAPVPRPDGGRAQRVVSTARAMIGTPYRYGGTSSAGVDCSGFVVHVFREAAGLKLPHSSRRQYDVSHRVPAGDETPSDLIFFRIHGSQVSHVGIYLGQGKFVHASDAGDTVKISDANEPYWRARRVGLGRVLD